MGKATRWFRGLLGMKKESKSDSHSSSERNGNSLNREDLSNCGEKKEKKRWSFAKSGKDDGQNSGNIPVIDTAWLRSETEKEQNKHAIAVAAATAAAADAAVAAAQAAVAVVRLTSQSRGGLFSCGREKWAAIKIQTVYRGYLARKALRALKGLVKLQALVKGYLVRKRAAATLRSMQALFRAQTAARTQRARHSMANDYRYAPELRARKSIERFDETRSEFHSKRLSASYEPSYAFDESPKIVEIDTYKPRSRSRRINTCESEHSDDQHYQAVSSPLPFPLPPRISVPDCRHHQDFDWSFLSDDYKFATANSTPRLANSGRSNAPVTPAKSVCGDSLFRPYSNYPSYMANTRSFQAKLRSHSAPKQRPEKVSKNRLSLNEIMASRSSFSGVRMQHPCHHVHEDLEY